MLKAKTFHVQHILINFIPFFKVTFSSASGIPSNKKYCFTH